MTMVAKVLAHAIEHVDFDEIPAGNGPLEVFNLFILSHVLGAAGEGVLVEETVEVDY